jgi:hypothetical protein
MLNCCLGPGLHSLSYHTWIPLCPIMTIVAINKSSNMEDSFIRPRILLKISGFHSSKKYNFRIISLFCNNLQENVVGNNATEMVMIKLKTVKNGYNICFN